MIEFIKYSDAFKQSVVNMYKDEESNDYLRRVINSAIQESIDQGKFECQLHLTDKYNINYFRDLLIQELENNYYDIKQGDCRNGKYFCTISWKVPLL